MVRVRPGSNITAEELRDHAAGLLAPFKVPAHVWFREEPFPRGPTGKIQKRELRDLRVSALVSTKRRGRVLVVSLRREDKRNAVNRELADELDVALNALDDDPDVWVGILTGTSSVFSAGSDLTSQGDYVTVRGGEYGVIRRGGTAQASHCRRRGVRARRWVGSAPRVRPRRRRPRRPLRSARGGPGACIPTCGGLFRRHRALPRRNLAREIILTGQPVGAERGYTLPALSTCSPSAAPPSTPRSNWGSGSAPTHPCRCRRACGRSMRSSRPATRTGG